MKNKKESKLVRVVLLVNLVLAVILMSSMSYAYFVSKDIIADNKIEIGTIDVKGVVSNLQVPAAFTVDGGKADITTNGSILINNATPNTTFTFDLTLTNISSLNNCYNIIFNSAVVSVVDSFSVSAVREGGRAADNLSFSSLSGRKESNLVAWDASTTDTTRKYNFTLTIGDNPVGGAFNIDIISTQKSAGNFVSNLTELINTPSGGLAVFANDIGTAVAPVAAIALTKPLNINLNGYTLYTQGFSMVDSNASGTYAITNGKIVTTVNGVVVNLPKATLNIADSVFQVPAGKTITITGAPHTVNISGATSFQQESPEGYVDVAANIAKDTRVIIARSVPKAILLNVVAGGVVIINESTAPSAIALANTVTGQVRIENSGALASVTNNTSNANAAVEITNNTAATLASIVVAPSVKAKVDICNNGSINTLTADGTADLNVVNGNSGAITTTGGANPNKTAKDGVSTPEELQAALNSSQPIIYVAKDINVYTKYTVNRNVKIIGMIRPSDKAARHISDTITCPPDTTGTDGKIVAALTEEYVAFRDVQQKDINLTTEIGYSLNTLWLTAPTTGAASSSASNGVSYVTARVVTQVFSNGVQLTKAQMSNYDIKIYYPNVVEAPDKLSKTYKFTESPTHYLENATLVDPVANPTIAGTLVGAVAGKTNYTVQADGSILVTYHQDNVGVGRYYLVLSEKVTGVVRFVSGNFLMTDSWMASMDDVTSDYLDFKERALLV